MSNVKELKIIEQPAEAAQEETLEDRVKALEAQVTMLTNMAHDPNHTINAATVDAIARAALPHVQAHLQTLMALGKTLLEN